MLLDVNVLLALVWPQHQFHEAAHAWLSEHLPKEWLTCAVTQLGLIRLSSNPSFTEAAVSPAEAAELARRLLEHPNHRFIELLPSPAAEHDRWRGVAGHRQTTDAFLVMVAIEHQSRLVTFDRRIASNPDFRSHVELLPPL